MCRAVYYNGAASLSVCRSDIGAKKEVANEDLLCTHGAINRKHLSARKLSPELNDIINEVVNTANDIRRKALHSGIFESLCERLGSQYHHPLFRAEVRWLLKRRVLTTFLGLREEAN